ncbi:MAG: flagellar hook-length control protein FliK [Candidatus Margulisbacteria bacterium]|nr:flagellar hook-length control protein FliK [Candidatus Margulisiibacteriota bacterium]
MAIEISQALAPDIGLFSDTHTQNQPSSSSFQYCLDEEQKKLALLFFPFGSFDFSTWFSYPAFSGGSSAGKFNEGIQIPEAELNYSESAAAAQNKTPSSFSEQLTGAAFSASPQKIIENILLKNGWFTPNIEALPLFLQSSMNKQFLAKMDLQSLVDEILTQVKLVKGKGRVELSIGLKPESLGEILLTLTATSGMISIQIESNDKTRKILEDSLADLKAALKKANVNLAEITVSAVKEAKKDA